MKAPESHYYFIYQRQNIFKYGSVNIYMKLKPFDSHFLPPPARKPPRSRTNTDSVHKTHFEIQDEKIHTTKFVFVSVRDSHEYIRTNKTRKKKEEEPLLGRTTARLALFTKSQSHTGGLRRDLKVQRCACFAACLYSNTSFLQQAVRRLSLCVVHFGPDGRRGRVVVFF